jgi:hypothetical protein
MPTITEKISLTREKRDVAEEEFREALRAGRDAGMSWSQLATVSGMSRWGARYLVLNLNERRVAAAKVEK